jgi:hypothetical protein
MQPNSFFFDLPPIPGGLHALFYTGLLILCLVDHPSPLDAPQIVGRVSPLFYTPPRLLRLLGVPMPGLRLLRLVRGFTLGVWVLAAGGFLQPVTAVLTFLGFAFLHAANAGALGSNHSTHSALYALFALCFSVSDDALSLDHFLRERMPWPHLVPVGSVLASGFARKLLLISLVYVMLAGGIAKVRNGGRAWFTGKMLRFYIRESAGLARSPWLSRVLQSSPRLCRAMAVGTVIVECSGVLALIDSRFTPWVVLAWVGLHIGILLVMMPAYWVQMWCYLLLLDWHALLGLGSGRRWLPAPGDPAVTALTVFGGLYCLVLLLVFLRHSEEWPFTSVPMYSNGTLPVERKPSAAAELHARAAAARRGDVTAWHRPWVSTEIEEDVMIVSAGGEPAQPLFAVLAEHGQLPARWSQWGKVIREVTIADLAAKPADRPGADGPDFPAARFLSRLAGYVRERLPETEHGRLDLVCPTLEGLLVIGSAPLPGEPSEKLASEASR